MDKFRNYIQENIDGLDCEIPSAKILENVRSHMAKNKQSTFRKLLQNKYVRAACVIGILATVAIFSIKNGREKINSTKGTLTLETRIQHPKTVESLTSKSKREEKVKNDGIRQNRSLAKKVEKKRDVNNHEDTSRNERIAAPQQIENDIDFVVDRYVKVINTTPLLTEPPTYFDYFVQEYKRIDKAKSAIEESIKRDGARDVLLRQLVDIGQQKLRILKDLEKEIHKTNSFYEERAGLNATKPLYMQL